MGCRPTSRQFESVILLLLQNTRVAVVNEFGLRPKYHRFDSGRVYLFCSVIPNGKGPVLKTGDESHYRFESYTLRNMSVSESVKSEIIEELIIARRVRFAMNVDDMFIDAAISRQHGGPLFKLLRE